MCVRLHSVYTQRKCIHIWTFLPSHSPASTECHLIPQYFFSPLSLFTISKCARTDTSSWGICWQVPIHQKQNKTRVCSNGWHSRWSNRECNSSYAASWVSELTSWAGGRGGGTPLCMGYIGMCNPKWFCFSVIFVINTCRVLILAILG